MPSGIWFNVIHLKSRPKRMHVLFFLLLPFQEGWILGPKVLVDLVLNPPHVSHVSTTLNHFQPLSATKKNLPICIFHSFTHQKDKKPFLSYHLPPGDSPAELVRSSALERLGRSACPGPRCDPSMRKPPAGRTNLSRASRAPGWHHDGRLEWAWAGLGCPKHTGSGNMRKMRFERSLFQGQSLDGEMIFQVVPGDSSQPRWSRRPE